MGLGACQIRKRPSGPDGRVEKRCQHYELCEGCQTEWVFKYRPQCRVCYKIAEVAESARREAAEKERLSKMVGKSAKDEVKHEERNKKTSEKNEARQNRTAARLKLKSLLPTRLRPLERSEPTPVMAELEILEDMPTSGAPEQEATELVEMIKGSKIVTAEPVAQFG